MSTLPSKWAWIAKVDGLPKLVQVALKEYGVVEGVNASDNSRILKWADEVAAAQPTPYTNWAADFFNKDSIPWCGLFIAMCIVRAGRQVVAKYLAALSWAAFGIAVDFRILDNIWLGDIGVFVRAGGGHVGIIIGISKDGKYVYVLGGNQNNQVNVTKLEVSRLYAVRRPIYSIGRPAGARHFRLTIAGTVSKDER